MSSNYKIDDNELKSQLGSRDTNESLVFAQISDPHLSSLDSIRFNDLTNKRLLGYLSWKRRRKNIHKREILDSAVTDIKSFHPDHIVITGDLTHIGHPSEFDQTLDWLQSLGSPHDITLIPGNHDCYVASKWQETFGKWMPYFHAENCTDFAFANKNNLTNLFPTLTIKGPIAFIGLSSAVPSPPFFATGALGQGQLQRLKKMLNNLKNSHLCKVLLIHHPPMQGVAKWRKRLTDAEKLVDLLSVDGIDLALHGHEHKQSLNFLNINNNSVPVVGMPSSSSTGEAPFVSGQYYLYHVIRRLNAWEINVYKRGIDHTLNEYCTTSLHQYMLSK